MKIVFETSTAREKFYNGICDNQQIIDCKYKAFICEDIIYIFFTNKLTYGHRLVLEWAFVP